MDCWTILGIEPNSDKKTIKIAYAKQLKTTRPDDDADAFQRLHEAYKTALVWVPSEREYAGEDDWMVSPQPEELLALEPPEKWEPLPGNVNSDDGSTGHFSPEEIQLLEDIRNQEQYLSEDWANFCEELDALIASPTRSAQLANWQFIEALPSMRDLEFRKAISDRAFEAVAEANALSLQKKHLYIKRPILNYLNGLFGWDKKWQEYEYSFSRSQLNAVYPYLEEADRVNKRSKIKRELFYYRRGAAFAIDLVIMFLPLLFVDPLAELLGMQDMVGELLMSWFGLYVLLLIPLQESSKAQATLGKRVMGLMVIDRRGDRINFMHALSRSMVTAFCVVAFKLVVFVNLILAWWRSEILQDLLTSSYVVQKPKQP